MSVSRTISAQLTRTSLGMPVGRPSVSLRNLESVTSVCIAAEMGLVKGHVEWKYVRLRLHDQLELCISSC